VAKAVEEAKSGRIEYRADSKSGNNAQAPIGRLSFEETALVENAQAFIDAILRARPSATKGQYIRKLIISSVMGPGIKIDRTQIAA
jgi:large subunit ribosomal protein L1